MQFGSFEMEGRSQDLPSPVDAHDVIGLPPFADDGSVEPYHLPGQGRERASRTDRLRREIVKPAGPEIGLPAIRFAYAPEERQQFFPGVEAVDRAIASHSHAG